MIWKETDEVWSDSKRDVSTCYHEYAANSELREICFELTTDGDWLGLRLGLLEGLEVGLLLGEILGEELGFCG